ncbi:phage tail tube protein [Brevundimonas balnearis]|jgi:predicted secreted protein|uniref:Phage tail tube protein n=1 Tax=Brevundimonas balnearis TaxID=1572858 RepID=A0ABV6R3Y7_9CAUL
MAEVKHARGVKLLIKVGDGADPEVFAAQCSINAERGITFTAGANEQEIPDCADPDAIAWIVREKTNLSVSITGSGVLDTSDVQDFYDWLTGEDTKNVKVVVDVPSADGGVVFTGAFHLTEFSITGNRGEKMQASISLASSGAVTSAANT